MQRNGGASSKRIAVLQISRILGKPPNYQVAVDFALIVFGFDWKFHPTSKETFPKEFNQNQYIAMGN